MSGSEAPRADPNTLVQRLELPQAAVRKDCLSCRVVGTATLTGVGTYALWQARASAPGGPGQKKIVAGLGLALIAGGFVRWFQ